MYSSSSSSSSSSQSERSMGPTGLIRYGSAPSTLLTTAVDSVINNNNNSSSGAGSSAHHHHNHHQEFSIFGSSPLQTASFSMAAPLPHPPPPQQQHRYFTGADWPPLSPDSNCKVNAHTNPNLSPDQKRPDKGLQRSSGFLSSNNNNNNNNNNDLHSANLKIGAGGSSSSTSNLVRHSSSPAGFLSHLMPETGFSAMRGSGSYSRGGSNGGGHGTSRLKPQLSFTRQDSALSHISEVNENVIEGLHTSNGHHRDSAHTFAYGTDSWDNNSHSITFSSPSNKRAKNNGEGLFLNCLETQYSMPHAEMDKLMIPEDSVTCKIRAKRGCATHPRSIAERERRTRISGKLKKLQDLVPNMDKQTSYADMLDLAVQHIKGLQEQVEKLNKIQERCTCGCKLSKT